MMSRILNRLIFLFVAFLLSINSASQTQYSWRTDFSSGEGPIARIDVPFNSSTRSYMIIFEYKRKCEPLFASLTTKTSGAMLGPLIQGRAINPGIYYLTINDVRHTWHGGFTEYQNAIEIAIGLTQQAWDSLLSGPSYMFFVEGDDGIYNVPVRGIVSAIKSASQICLRKL
jgi:hypothetical protein